MKEVMAAGIRRDISSQQGQAHGREFGGALGVEKNRDSHTERQREKAVEVPSLCALYCLARTLPQGGVRSQDGRWQGRAPVCRAVGHQREKKQRNHLI